MSLSADSRDRLRSIYCRQRLVRLLKSVRPRLTGQRGERQGLVASQARALRLIVSVSSPTPKNLDIGCTLLENQTTQRALRAVSRLTAGN